MATTTLSRIGQRLRGKADADLGARVDELEAEIADLDRRLARGGARSEAHSGVTATRERAALALEHVARQLARGFVQGHGEGFPRFDAPDMLAESAKLAAIAGVDWADAMHAAIDGDPLPGVPDWAFGDATAEYAQPRAKLVAELTELRFEQRRRQHMSEREEADAKASAELDALARPRSKGTA
jgi:hypothetical protein